MRYFLALALLAVAAAALACGDDGDDSNGNGDGSPTVTATVIPARRAEIIEVMRTYLSEVGLDGTTGALSEPVECDRLGDNPEGDFCIIEPSVYAPALGLVLIGDTDDPANEVWQVRAVFENDEWEVTETIKLE